MLAKSERLTKADFSKIKPKIIFRGNFVEVSVHRFSEGEKMSRFSCVLSKKRVKRAVDRNRIKRKVYAVLSKNKPKKPHQVIIYPKITALSGSRTGLNEEISKAFDTLY